MRRHTARIAPIFLLFTLAACNGTSKQKAIQHSLTALNAARDGFVAWDKAKQDKIVDQATSLEQGKAALKDYRSEREKILLSFQVAYGALATASLDPSAEMFLEAISTVKAVFLLVKEFKEKDEEKPQVPETDAAPAPVPEGGQGQ